MPPPSAPICQSVSLCLLLLMTLTAAPPVAAQALRRDEVLAEAARYAEHVWEMRAANQKGACQGTYRSDHAVGKQVGVPYAWGGWMSLTEFDRRIAEGQGAGSHSSDGILSCVAGVDCSGFVSQVWRLKQRQSTSTLGKVTRPITLDELQPGDALNKAGKHVVLFVGTTPEGKPIIYEASGSASRVRMATPSWSYLNGYQPIRYPGLEEPSALASAPVPKTSAPLTEPAKPAATVNAQAAVVPAVASPASSAPASAAPAPATPASSAAAAVPAVATPASSAPAAVPAVATPASSAPAAAVLASTASVPTPAVFRRSLRYGVDVGFQPASEDAQALGPDYLTAGPKGVAVLYDRVRRQVLVLTRDGAPRAFDAGRVDGLGFTPQGDIVVTDSSLRQLRLYRLTGELQRTLDVPRQGPLGVLALEDGVLYATTPDGQRKAIAELASGRLRLPRRSVELSKEQLLLLKERVPGGLLMEVGGEGVVVPERVRVSARRLGPWIELVLAATDANGQVRVERSLRRRGQAVALPDGARGSYAPVADLAVATDGTVIYLEPGEQEVSLAWVDAV